MCKPKDRLAIAARVEHTSNGSAKIRIFVQRVWEFENDQRFESVGYTSLDGNFAPSFAFGGLGMDITISDGKTRFGRPSFNAAQLTPMVDMEYLAAMNKALKGVEAALNKLIVGRGMVMPNTDNKNDREACLGAFAKGVFATRGVIHTVGQGYGNAGLFPFSTPKEMISKLCDVIESVENEYGRVFAKAA